MQSSDIQISIHWCTCKPTPDDDEKTRREGVFRIKLINFSKALFPCLAFSLPFQFSLGFSEQFRNLTLQYYVTSDQAFLSSSEKTDKRLIVVKSLSGEQSYELFWWSQLSWVTITFVRRKLSFYKYHAFRTSSLFVFVQISNFRFRSKWVGVSELNPSIRFQPARNSHKWCLFKIL